MGLGRFLHDHPEHTDHGGTIDRPRAYEVAAAIGFAGRRRRATVPTSSARAGISTSPMPRSTS
jgi:hypothetical protein